MISRSSDGGIGRERLSPRFIDDDSPEFDDALRQERLDIEADRRHDIDAFERQMASDDLAYEQERERRSHFEERGRDEMAADLEVDRRREERLVDPCGLHDRARDDVLRELGGG